MDNPDIDADDERLVAAAQADLAAFAIVYRRHLPSLYRYLCSRLPTEEEAADLTQQPEVLLAMPATAVQLREMGLGGAYAESCQRPFFVVIMHGDFAGDFQYIGYVFDQGRGAPGDVMIEIQSPTDEPFREVLGGEPVMPPITASPDAEMQPPDVGGCEDIWS